MVNVVELGKVKDLDNFVKKLSEAGYVVEHGPHVVLEDHSEITTMKVYRDNNIVAYVVAHYITQYYRAILSNSYGDDQAFLEKLLEIKHSGEKWRVPVNPVYVIVFDEDVSNVLAGYEDRYPTQDAESLVEAYRSKNPDYSRIPRIVVARLLEAF